MCAPLPLSLVREEHAGCGVFEKQPLISPGETLQRCRGQRGAKLPDPDVSRCRLRSMHAAQNLLGSRSRSSGQTHFHILWMFWEEQNVEKTHSFEGCFFFISSCMNVSAVFLHTPTAPTPETDLCLEIHVWIRYLASETIQFGLKLDVILPSPCPSSTASALPPSSTFEEQLIAQAGASRGFHFCFYFSNTSPTVTT